MCAALLSGALPASSPAAQAPGPAHTQRPRSADAHEAIIGGEPARGGAFASVAQVVDVLGKESELCTGTVVAPSLVLTAAHCVENINTGALHAASGVHVLTVGIDGAPEQVSTVAAVIVYEGFVRKVDDGDAALLVLSTPASAPPVTLASSASLPVGATATIAGWGEMRYEHRLPTSAPQSAYTVVQSDRWCKHSAPPFYAGEEICTIDPPRYATGACFGDSGGPLLLAGATGGAFVEIGIAVHVYGKCSTTRPSVFTSVDRIAAWVKSWIDAYSTPPSTPASPAPVP